MSILILPFLLGAVLGTHFRVLVLVPVIGTVVVMALLAGLAGGTGLSAVAMSAALAVSCIQVGYIAGMLLSGLSSRQAVQAKSSRSA